MGVRTIPRYHKTTRPQDLSLHKKSENLILVTMKTSLPQAVLITAFFYGAAQAQTTLPDAKPSLIVEPFIGQWCANQFPNELNSFDGYDMVSMMKGSHTKLEPFLGEWCFDQFTKELQNQNRDQTILSLYNTHKQVEPYLQDWGKDSMEPPRKLISLEPYIGRWCAAQFPSELRERSKDMQSFVASVSAEHVKLEPVLAKWCFKQFPDPLNTQNNADTIEGLKFNHALVENEIIKWVMSTETKASSSSSSASPGLVAWASIATVAFAGTLAALSVLLYRGRKNSGSPGVATSSRPTSDVEVI